MARLTCRLVLLQFSRLLLGVDSLQIWGRAENHLCSILTTRPTFSILPRTAIVHLCFSAHAPSPFWCPGYRHLVLQRRKDGRSGGPAIIEPNFVQLLVRAKHWKSRQERDVDEEAKPKPC